MEERIKFEDIFAEDIFQRAATSAKALNEVLKELDETLKKIAKENAEVIKSLAGAEKSAQNLQKLAQATQQAEQAVRSSVQVSKERARIEQKLKELTTQEARELALLSQQLRRLRSETMAQAKAADILARSQQLVEKATKNSFESYKDLSDTLADLRSLYKDLAAAGKGDTDEAKQLLGLVQQLDARVKELDIDSIAMAEMVHELEQRLSLRLNERVFETENIDELAALIEQLRESSAPKAQ